MTLRQEGIEWLAREVGATTDPVHVSKMYRADESWNRWPVWWFEFSGKVLEDPDVPCIHLLCQTNEDAGRFVHVRVPNSWLREHKGDLCVRAGGKVSLYLSAEDDTLYREVRGAGQLDFSGFAK